MAESLNIESGEGEYTKDGSVDLKGNSILRSKRGGWTACSFIVVYEMVERMAYYGISSNLVIYLTENFHQGTVDAANNVTTWVGTVFLTPIVGAYIADAYFARYWTFVTGSVIYLLGMLLLTLAVSVPALKPSSCNSSTCPPASELQLGIFFSGLYIIAIGNGATKPNISTIGADQFDEFHPKEKKQKLSFFNWWMSSIIAGILAAQTFLVYLQDNVGWTIGYGIPTLALIISVAIFMVGTPFYRHKLPQGSPLNRMGRVIVASVRKWKLAFPDETKELHELDGKVYERKRTFRIDSTDSMRFLNKAAIKGTSDAKWTLCTVTEVEETKQVFRLVPILLTMFIPCTMLAQINTLFVKQGTTLDRHLGPHFHIPPACLQAFVTVTTLISIIAYDRYFVKIMRKWTKNPRGVSLLQRIAIGLVLQIITMLTASLIEKKRLSIARSQGLDKSGGQLPVTIFILLPQFVLMGVADAFWIVGKLEFFYDQAPDSMKSLGTAVSLFADGMGSLVSTFLLQLVSNITRKQGNEWVPNNLNASHLDYYYFFLTILSVVNCLLFLLVSRFYSYKAEIVRSTIDDTREEQETIGNQSEEYKQDDA